MQYDGDAHIPKNYLVEPPHIDNTLSDYLCATGIHSYAVSETQKFGHVTYFWNGNKSGYIDEDREKYVEISSDRVPFDQRPWMKAAEITDEAIATIRSGRYKFIRLNYPNGDMVGHTGNPEAVRLAVESLDLCLGRTCRGSEKAWWNPRGYCRSRQRRLHVDREERAAPAMVAHTRNPVPFIIKLFHDNNRFRLNEHEDIGLTNVAATLCVLLGYHPPEGYRPSLVKLVDTIES